MKKNPFKFGSVVDGKYFTNRTQEIDELKSVLKSSNHLIIISPRRFGKISLIMKILNELDRPHLYLDLQLVLSVEDFAAQLLKRVHRIFQYEKLKALIKNFQIIPRISINPLNNEVDVTFNSKVNETVVLEDVLNLIDNLQRDIIVVIDEFQEVNRIGKDLDKYLRAVIQHHQNINYVFLGSQEHLMRNIFEKKNSAFYHFGYLYVLNKIPEVEFRQFLYDGLSGLSEAVDTIIDEILSVTQSHPYFTQQFAFVIYELLSAGCKLSAVEAVEYALNEIIRTHDMDFERLWNTFNRTDRAVLIGMADDNLPPLSIEFQEKIKIRSSSTIFSSLKRLSESGIVIKTSQKYEIDDPFFSRWLIARRNV